MATVGHGSRISIGRDAVLEMGDGFVNTAMGTIVCLQRIKFGESVVTSWNTLIMDTDWHSVLNISDGTTNTKTQPIVIGSNVWVGTRSLILKGSVVPDGCIVGAGAVITKAFTEDNCAICGNPAKVVKQGVTKYRGKE